MRIFIILSLILIALFLGCEENQSNLTRCTDTMPNTNTISNTTKIITTNISFQPIVLNGISSEKTKPFSISTEEWIIEWEYTPEKDLEEFELVIFNFYIYPRGETLFFSEMIFPEDTTGSSYSYAGPGQYYADVTAANIESWTITIRSPQ